MMTPCARSSFQVVNFDSLAKFHMDQHGSNQEFADEIARPGLQ